jgi:hypothetical protein
MQRSSLVPVGFSLGISLFGAVIYLPTIARAATFFGPIISTACNCDPAGGISANGITVPYSAPAWGCILSTFQNVLTLGVSLSVVIITIFIAWAGFSYIMSGGNPEKRSQANKRIMNAVIGLLIVLCSYLLVDSIMKELYDPSTAKFGPWNSILAGTSAEDCLSPVASPGGLPGVTAALNTGSSASTGSTNSQQSTVPAGNGKGGTAQCSPSNTACSVSALESAGLSAAQAQAMSCIAVSESSGNPNTPDSSTGACGTFQITNRPGNWSNPAFHTGSCSVNTSCNDAGCNMQTAIIMVQKQGFQPWTGINPKTGQPWNPTAVSCVNNFDPSGH